MISSILWSLDWSDWKGLHCLPVNQSRKAEGKLKLLVKSRGALLINPTLYIVPNIISIHLKKKKLLCSKWSIWNHLQSPVECIYPIVPRDNRASPTPGHSDLYMQEFGSHHEVGQRALPQCRKPRNKESWIVFFSLCNNNIFIVKSLVFISHREKWQPKSAFWLCYQTETSVAEKCCHWLRKYLLLYQQHLAEETISLKKWSALLLLKCTNFFTLQMYKVCIIDNLKITWVSNREKTRKIPLSTLLFFQQSMHAHVYVYTYNHKHL